MLLIKSPVRVFGKNKNNNPDISAKAPKIKLGRGAQTSACYKNVENVSLQKYSKIFLKDFES